MRVFIYEHVTGGGLAGSPLPASLRSEGAAMLRSVVEDFARASGVGRVATTIDPRLAGLGSVLARGPVEVAPAGPGRMEEVFRELADWSDRVLVVAPEIGGALLERTRAAMASGKPLLGSRPEGVDLAGDKLRLARLLKERGVPVAPLEPVDLAAPPPAVAEYPAVLKPRFGAGSVSTYLLRGPEDAARAFASARAEGAPPEMVLGPYLPGTPASASFLCGPGKPVALLSGRQVLSGEGRFRYLGGRLPLERGLAARALRLGERAVRELEGLCGFVGVDLVLSSSGAEHDAVVEVNPRLTTSYVGLRVLARGNLASRWLALVEKVDAPPLEWYCNKVSFFPEGEVLMEGEAKA